MTVTRRMTLIMVIPSIIVVLLMVVDQTSGGTSDWRDLVIAEGDHIRITDRVNENIYYLDHSNYEDNDYCDLFCYDLSTMKRTLIQRSMLSHSFIEQEGNDLVWLESSNATVDLYHSDLYGNSTTMLMTGLMNATIDLYGRTIYIGNNTYNDTTRVDILTYDLNTNVQEHVASNVYHGMIQIDGSSLVFSRYQNKTSKIILLDMETGNETIIVDNGHSVDMPWIKGSTVVWRDTDLASRPFLDDIRGLDLDTGDNWTIRTADQDDNMVFILGFDGSLLLITVWPDEHFPYPVEDIFIIDVNGSKVIKVNKEPAFLASTHMESGDVLWTEYVDEDTELLHILTKKDYMEPELDTERPSGDNEENASIDFTLHALILTTITLAFLIVIKLKRIYVA